MNDTILHLPQGITVALCPIEPTENRRLAERAAVARLCRLLLGPDVVIRHKPDGSPFVEGCSVHISVSHSRRTALLALSPHYIIGADIEELSRAARVRRVGARVMSAAELETYGDSDSDLLRAWTLKEALYKVAGEPGIDWRSGLVLPPGKDSGAARAGKRRCRIVHSAPLGDEWLSVVIAG